MTFSFIVKNFRRVSPKAYREELIKTAKSFLSNYDRFKVDNERKYKLME